MFYEPLFRDPPKNTPPKFPPPVCKIWRFLGPPPDPPFFGVLARDPLGHDPWPPSFMMFFDRLVLSLRLWSSIMHIIDDVMFINFIYKHAWLLSMHQGAPSFMRLNDSSSWVLLRRIPPPLPITMAKPSLLPYPYSIIIHYYPVYRVYLPFYRVKNPISPSLSWVFRLTPPYPPPP